MATRTNKKILSHADVMINELGDQTTSLTRKNAELESFAHVVSHDLKTPIRAIQSLSEFIEEDIDELVSKESTKALLMEHTRRINEQIDKSNTLIKGILKFSIVGKVYEIAEPVDVLDLVSGVCRSLGISPEYFTFTSPMPSFETYAMRLSQVFENLIGNAYKYHPNPAKMQIAISFANNGDYYRFYVSDNGVGIDQQYRDRVFEPFVTLQTAPDTKSSGIGLSIVKKSVEVMGGRIGIVDGYYNGVKFYFDWPQNALEIDNTIEKAA